MDKKLVGNAISTFENIKANDVHGYEEAVKIFQSIKKLPVVIDKLSKGTRLCRSRLHLEDVLYLNVDEVSTPKPHHVKAYGRCNRINVPIFYCSENRPTSYFEILEDALENGDENFPHYATISVWYTKREMNFVIVPSPDEKDRITEFDKYYGHAWDKNLLTVRDDEKEAYILYYRYLFKKFHQKADDISTYFITCAYTDLALSNAGDKADGVMFPSVPSRGSGLNFALKPEVIIPGNLELRDIYRNRFVIDDSEPKRVMRENQILKAADADFETGIVQW